MLAVDLQILHESFLDDLNNVLRLAFNYIKEAVHHTGRTSPISLQLVEAVCALWPLCQNPGPIYSHGIGHASKC